MYSHHIHIALVLLGVSSVTNTLEILQREQAGCLAKVRTGTIDKWIYLKDNYIPAKDSMQVLFTVNENSVSVNMLV